MIDTTELEITDVVDLLSELAHGAEDPQLTERILEARAYLRDQAPVYAIRDATALMAERIGVMAPTVARAAAAQAERDKAEAAELRSRIESRQIGARQANNLLEIARAAMTAKNVGLILLLVLVILLGADKALQLLTAAGAARAAGVVP